MIFCPFESSPDLQLCALKSADSPLRKQEPWSLWLFLDTYPFTAFLVLDTFIVSRLTVCQQERSSGKIRKMVSSARSDSRRLPCIAQNELSLWAGEVKMARQGLSRDQLSPSFSGEGEFDKKKKK